VVSPPSISTSLNWIVLTCVSNKFFTRRRIASLDLVLFAAGFKNREQSVSSFSYRVLWSPLGRFRRIKAIGDISMPPRTAGPFRR